ncbi:MAG: GMC family oxidoreductase [Okeania sp. SIO3I5]|uniref:GMC family oxidoreductase N-terminal domain-containing protein n=1 Tax=Okeania sp. SIO3I5 TaxID=2607805 RepID=UPI0013B69467|nr:GMC family oxidoreductase [Okeania sp. SIO3I5]NEQ37995.1 GMC family oxidoreductase [Okeania sp. SIO3I5]
MTVCEHNILTEPDTALNCEVAIVGSGPGGAVTAATLSKAGLDVLLIEEGPYLPLESCAPFSQQEMVQKYRNRGLTVAFGAPKIQYIEGRCVGGGSEVNSGLYHRTPSDVLAHWREKFQVQNLTQAELEPHYEACENAVSISYLPGKPSLASLKLQEGATQLGWQSQEVPRWFKYESNNDSSVPLKGTKQSMTKTYVPEMLRTGGKILANTKIKIIRRQGDRWILQGRYTNSSSSYQIKITAKTVFIAAGAVHTPALLRRSGITRNIGNALQMHPTVKVVAQFSEPVSSAQLDVAVHQVKEFAPQLSFGGSISSLPYLQLAMVDYPEYAQEVNQHWQNMNIYYVSLVGTGRGTVRCLPGFDDPLVRYNLPSDDLKVLASGLKNLCRLLMAAKAKALFPLVPNATRLTQLAEIDRLPQQLPSDTSLMTVHLFSSCPMGENLDLCATNSFGKVHGQENLYVADASLLCTAPGVNPQGSVMAIARRNALHFLEES